MKGTPPYCPDGRGCVTHLCQSGNPHLKGSQPPGHCVRAAIDQNLAKSAAFATTLREAKREKGWGG